MFHIILHLFALNVFKKHLRHLEGKGAFGGTHVQLYYLTRGPQLIFAVAYKPKILGTTGLIFNNASLNLKCNQYGSQIYVVE